MEDCQGTAVRIEGGELLVVRHGVPNERITSTCLQHSALLQDVLSSTDVPAEAVLPVSTAAMQAWMQHVNRVGTDARPRKQPRHVSCALQHDPVEPGTTTGRDQVDRLLELYLVADALIDDSTRAETAAELAACIQRSTEHTQAPLLHHASARLPTHLLLAVLCHLNLAHLLLHLPPTFHPAALRAHHPSIDSHSSLSLPLLPPRATPPAIAAAATLTNLSFLSLARRTTPSATPAAFTPLSSLHALTSLDLSNTGLDTHAATAIAAALPSLSLLATLDLSDNVLPEPAMRVVAPALAQCPALHTLKLLKTMPFTPAGCGSLAVLAHSMHAMPRLSRLSLGNRRPGPTGCLSQLPYLEGFATEYVDLVAALARAAALRELALEYGCELWEEEARPLAGALARLTAIRSLRLDAPRVQPADLSLPDHMHAQSSSAKRRDWRALGQAVATLTQLTSLELLLGDADARLQTEWLLAAGTLTSLRRLSLHSMHVRMSEPVIDAGSRHVTSALAPLRQLTAFHMDRRNHDHAPHASIDTMTLQACSLPALRVLHVPVAAPHTSEACRSALLAATHLDSLTIDMHVSNEVLVGSAAGITPDVTPFTALIPYATIISCESYSDDDAWIRPLLPAIAAHSTLSGLCVCAGGMCWDGAVQDLLEGVPALTCLRALKVWLAVPRPVLGAAAATGTGALALPNFYAHLSRLTALTALQVSIWPDAQRAAVGPHSATPLLPVAREMTSLAVLKLGHYPGAAHAACMAVLERLQLHTLLIDQVQSGHLPLLREALGRLPHLRSVAVSMLVDAEGRDTSRWRPEARQVLQETLQSAVAGLPTCQDVVVGSSRLDLF